MLIAKRKSKAIEAAEGYSTSDGGEVGESSFFLITNNILRPAKKISRGVFEKYFGSRHFNGSWPSTTCRIYLRAEPSTIPLCLLYTSDAADE